MTPVKYFVAYRYYIRLGNTYDSGFYSEIVEVGAPVQSNADLEDLQNRVQKDFRERTHAEGASINIITLQLL